MKAAARQQAPFVRRELANLRESMMMIHNDEDGMGDEEVGSRLRVASLAIAGAGFSGAILARQLRMKGVDVVCFEKSAQTAVRQHWTQPVTGAGLNINPNALACLAAHDPELERALRGIGLSAREHPRKHDHWA